MADPIEIARSVYESEPCARSFEEDLYLHMHTPGCIVYKDDANLALVRPVNIDDAYETLTNPGLVSGNPNAWWVYLLVGDIPFLLSLLPFEFTWIGWERKNKARFYELQHVKRWTTNTDPTSTPILFRTVV